jgi:hypothetical protein
MLPGGDVASLWPSGDMNEDLIPCLRCVSFTGTLSMLICYFDTDLHFWQAISLSKDLAAKRTVETVQASKSAELESVIAAQT